MGTIAVAAVLGLAILGLAGCGSRRDRSSVASGAGDSTAGSSSASAGEAAEESFAVDGLIAPVEILVDRWGVPHIYARNQDDLFLAQGWNAARDRLWQLDLWKRRGDGTLAEALGPGYVAKDRAARLLLYRGPGAGANDTVDLRDEWVAYAGDTKRIVTAFVAGINAYVGLTEERPDLLAPEFRVLDYRPARWTPETVVRIRSHGLLRNARSELQRALFLRRFGARALELRYHYEPEHRLEVPAGLDLQALDDGMLADYELATGAVSFAALLDPEPAESTSAAAAVDGPHDQDPDLAGDGAGVAAPATIATLPGDDFATEGSNNWALAGSRTTTGRPILANDPHRALEVPSLRYLVHLSSPGLELAGAGEPALPGVSLGHNGRVAFGFTIFAMDQEDLFVLRTRPAVAASGRAAAGAAGAAGDPPEYAVDGGWERMTEVRERVRVRGGDPAGVEVALRFTRFGPVIAERPERGIAIALRAAWLEAGMAPYLASLELQRVRDWDGFLAALNRWGLPGENLVYADVDGNIGWKPAGRAPIRAGWDGLLPVPGGARYRWTGYLDGDQLPVEVAPERGWVATANQMNLPPGYPHALAYEWSPPYRFDRIAEAFSAGARWSVEDAARLQADYLSLPARWLLARLAGVEGRSEPERGALALLRDWDGRLDAAAPAAALFEVWLRLHLPAAVWARVARAEDLDAAAAEALEAAPLPSLLAAIGRGSLHPEEEQAALLESLMAATADVEARLGADRAAWRWGALHHSRLEHPLAKLLRRDLGLEADVGPLPRGGSGDTPGATTYRTSDFRQESGASVRVVLDVGAWDQSLAMNTPGQSGVPGSPHYQDLFADWASDRSFPFLWSRPRIEAATVRRIRLEPSGAP